ncbi:MAG: flagellar hook-length control protein FliK [Proteobacteria bacterium]|nr:flagellar hook-length control protein FliK [Pseudomonadota bacterium]
MPSTAFLFAPVAPASAGTMTAASGTGDADKGLFSRKIGELLKAGSTPDARPGAKGLPPVAAATTFEQAEGDAAPSVVDDDIAAPVEENASDRSETVTGQALAAAPGDTPVADVFPVAPAILASAVVPPPAPVEAPPSTVAGEALSQAASPPQSVLTSTDAATPSDTPIAQGTGLAIPADILAASTTDAAVPPLPEPILEAAKDKATPAPDEQRAQSTTTSGAPASPSSAFAATAAKAQAAVAARIPGELASQAIQIIVSQTATSDQTSSPQAQSAILQAAQITKVEQADKIESKGLSAASTETPTKTTPADSEAVIKDAQTSGAPAKSLHHGDHASVSPVAVETTDKPAVTEASNVRKPTGTEASPAPAPATASPDAAGSPASAPVAASEVAQAVAPQDMPTQQAAPSTDRSSLASHLSRATIETTAHLAAQIARKLDGRSTRFDMVLTPEDLGRVDVSLEIGSDGQLAARLAFDNPAAAAELRGRADELRRQLQDAGFQVAGDALDFSQRDPSTGGGAFERQQQRNALFSGGSRLAREADALPLPAPGAWTTLSQTPDRVDLKV